MGIRFLASLSSLTHPLVLKQHDQRDCYLKLLPEDIFKTLFKMLPSKDICSLTASCKEYRSDKFLFELVCKRIGMDQMELVEDWKSLSKKFKKELSKLPFPLNFAEKNLLDISTKIVSKSIIDKMNQKGEELLEKGSYPQAFTFDCGISQEGMIVHCNNVNALPAEICLIKEKNKNSSVPSFLYKMSFEFNTNSDAVFLSERGKKVLRATRAIFNTIFVNTPVNEDKESPRNIYRFLSNAERPYVIFSKEVYHKALTPENIARNIPLPDGYGSKKCIIQ